MDVRFHPTNGRQSAVDVALLGVVPLLHFRGHEGLGADLSGHVASAVEPGRQTEVGQLPRAAFPAQSQAASNKHVDLSLQWNWLGELLLHCNPFIKAKP